MATLPPTSDSLTVDNFPTSRTFPPSPAPRSNPLPSYWTRHFSSLLTHYGKTGPLPSTADVVIIGSGLTGSTAAAQLVDDLIASPAPGKTTRVVVLEARTFCSGATGRNGGHLTAYPIAHFEALQQRYGTEDAIRAVKLEDEAIKWLVDVVHEEGWEEDVDLQEGGGTLILFDSPAQLASVRASLATASKAGLDSDKAKWVTPAEAKDKWGAECEGAVMVPGNNLYPLKFVTKLFQRALNRALSAAATATKKGKAPPVDLQLFTHTVASSVEAVDGEEGRWVVKTDRGDIETAHVLHATNGYLSSVLPNYTSSPSFPGILPTRAQVLSLLPTSIPSSSSFTANWKNAFSPTSANPGKGVNTYVFRRAYSAAGDEAADERGEIIIGGMREHTQGWERGVSDDSAVNEEVGKAVRESLGRTWEGVFELEKEGDKEEVAEEKVKLRVAEEWTGIMGYREEGNPIVGPVYIDGKKQQGQWISAGYSGHGMPRAPPCGQLVASLIYYHLTASSSSASSSSTSPPSASKPFALPPYFPRHLLSTPSGKGNPKTRLEEEGAEGEKEVEGKKDKNRRKEDGWVWVKGRGQKL